MSEYKKECMCVYLGEFINSHIHSRFTNLQIHKQNIVKFLQIFDFWSYMNDSLAVIVATILDSPL